MSFLDEIGTKLVDLEKKSKGAAKEKKPEFTLIEAKIVKFCTEPRGSSSIIELFPARPNNILGIVQSLVKRGVLIACANKYVANLEHRDFNVVMTMTANKKKADDEYNEELRMKFNPYVDAQGYVVYKLPFPASSVEDIFDIHNDDVQMLIHKTLHYNDYVETSDGNIFSIGEIWAETNEPERQRFRWEPSELYQKKADTSPDIATTWENADDLQREELLKAVNITSDYIRQYSAIDSFDLLPIWLQNALAYEKKASILPADETLWKTEIKDTVAALKADNITFKDAQEMTDYLVGDKGDLTIEQKEYASQLYNESANVVANIKSLKITPATSIEQMLYYTDLRDEYEKASNEEKELILELAEVRFKKITDIEKDYDWDDLGLGLDLFTQNESVGVVAEKKVSEKSFSTVKDYERWIRMNPNLPDVVTIGDVVFTMDNYDEEGKEVSYGNKENEKSFIVLTENRYKSHSDAKVSEIEPMTSYRTDITYEASKKIAIYISYKDEDGDIVFKIPFEAENIEQLVTIDDEELQEFLYSDLASSQGIETKDGNVFWGSDIQDALKNKTADEQKYYTIFDVAENLIENGYGGALIDVEATNKEPDPYERVDAIITPYVDPSDYPDLEFTNWMGGTDTTGKYKIVMHSGQLEEAYYEQKNSKPSLGVNKNADLDPIADGEDVGYLKVIDKEGLNILKKDFISVFGDITEGELSDLAKRMQAQELKNEKEGYDFTGLDVYGVMKEFTENRKKKADLDPIAADEQEVNLNMKDDIQKHFIQDFYNSLDIGKTPEEAYKQIKIIIEKAKLNNPELVSMYNLISSRISVERFQAEQMTEKELANEIEGYKNASVKIAGEIESDELVLYTENDGQLYERVFMPIIKNLTKKKKNNTYDSESAIKAFAYLAEEGAKKYAKDFGGTWNTMFDVSTRKQVATDFRDKFERLYENKEYDFMADIKQATSKISLIALVTDNGDILFENGFAEEGIGIFSENGKEYNVGISTDYVVYSNYVNEDNMPISGNNDIIVPLSMKASPKEVKDFLQKSNKRASETVDESDIMITKIREGYLYEYRASNDILLKQQYIGYDDKEEMMSNFLGYIKEQEENSGKIREQTVNKQASAYTDFVGKYMKDNKGSSIGDAAKAWSKQKGKSEDKPDDKTKVKPKTDVKEDVKSKDKKDTVKDKEKVEKKADYDEDNDANRTDEESTPEYGDYVMSDSGRLGSTMSVNIVNGDFLGTFDDEDSAMIAIKENMEEEHFWPNVWYQDDHGGLSLRTASVKKASPDISVGDVVKIDMSVVKKHDNIPPYIRLVNQAIKNAENGMPYVAEVDDHFIYIRAWQFDLLGDVRVPKEAIVYSKKASVKKAEFPIENYEKYKDFYIDINTYKVYTVDGTSPYFADSIKDAKDWIDAEVEEERMKTAVASNDEFVNSYLETALWSSNAPEELGIEFLNEKFDELSPIEFVTQILDAKEASVKKAGISDVAESFGYKEQTTSSIELESNTRALWKTLVQLGNKATIEESFFGAPSGPRLKYVKLGDRTVYSTKIGFRPFIETHGEGGPFTIEKAVEYLIGKEASVKKADDEKYLKKLSYEKVMDRNYNFVGKFINKLGQEISMYQSEKEEYIITVNHELKLAVRTDFTEVVDAKDPHWQTVFIDGQGYESQNAPAKKASIKKADSHDEFLDDYLVAALWSSHAPEEDGVEFLDEKYSLDDFSAEAVERAERDWSSFKVKAGALLNDLDLSQVAHDFWLTRNGHGAGFWDGDYEEEVGEKLTEISHEFGEIDVEVGDDGQLYFLGGKEASVKKADDSTWELVGTWRGGFKKQMQLYMNNDLKNLKVKKVRKDYSKIPEKIDEHIYSYSEASNIYGGQPEGDALSSYFFKLREEQYEKEASVKKPEYYIFRNLIEEYPELMDIDYREIPISKVLSDYGLQLAEDMDYEYNDWKGYQRAEIVEKKEASAKKADDRPIGEEVKILPKDIKELSKTKFIPREEQLTAKEANDTLKDLYKSVMELSSQIAVDEAEIKRVAAEMKKSKEIDPAKALLRESIEKLTQMLAESGKIVTINAEKVLKLVETSEEVPILSESVLAKLEALRETHRQIEKEYEDNAGAQMEYVKKIITQELKVMPLRANKIAISFKEIFNKIKNFFTSWLSDAKDFGKELDTITW